ncbi:MAG: hypothetical protein ACHQT6_00695 [Candidatus Acidiferrales bacterium]
MRGTPWVKRVLGTLALAGAMLAEPILGRGQEAEQPQNIDLAAAGTLLQQLRAQVQELHAQVQNLSVQQASAKEESAELRKELDAAKSQLASLAMPANTVQPGQALPGREVAAAATEERISKLEENQQLADSKIAEQSQTKMESGSKYRVRFSGMILFNTFENRGTVDNVDFPQLAEHPGALSSSGSFGAALRQSQIGIEAFGPTIAGARTSGDLQFDFAGGFPQTPNGVTFGIMRLRTGTIRLDWPNTSVVAGQDALFFTPLSTTSIATVAMPALAYSGNLWSWTPQVRVEHKFTVSESSSVLLQGGILDSLSGDTPPSENFRYPSWGESSGQPAFAARVAWTQNVNGQKLTLGAGGYYGRQAWGYGRGVDSWAGAADASVPLGKWLEFSGEFFRGRAIGGLGGGIGQSGLWNGSLLDPATQVYGLDALGGWAQLKYKATSKLQFNGAFGQDNPYAGDLRTNGGNTTYYPVPLSKNQSGLVNFIYQPRSDIVFSLEYRRLKTFALDSGANSANVFNLSVGYIF